MVFLFAGRHLTDRLFFDPRHYSPKCRFHICITPALVDRRSNIDLHICFYVIVLSNLQLHRGKANNSGLKTRFASLCDVFESISGKAHSCVLLDAVTVMQARVHLTFVALPVWNELPFDAKRLT